MASQEQHRLKQENMAAILATLRRGKVTRRELCRRVHLSWGCVSDLVSELIGLGLVCEEKAAGGAPGRRPLVLTLNREKRMMGLDINRIGITVCLCDLYGEKQEEQGFPIDCTDKASLEASIEAAMTEWLPQALGIGVAMQGMRRGDCWIFPGNGGNIEWSVGRLGDRPTWVEHDPNCLLLSFADHPEERTMLVRVDEGIGVSLYANGQFSQEPLELGQIITDGERLSAKVRRNDAKALGQALGNLCTLIRADQLVLCGKRMEQLDASVLQEVYRQTVLPSSAAKLRFVPLSHAALGAAKFALLHYVGQL